jgi:TRAP-type C4-dicarboxylate transport system permease small subunit
MTHSTPQQPTPAGAPVISGPGTRLLEYVCAFLLAAMVVFLFIQVLGRYALQNPPEWTEELGRTAFVYATFVGAALAVAKNAHMRIDAVVKLLPAAAQAWMQVLIHLIAITFLIFVVYQSAILLPSLAFQPLTSLPFLSKAWFFAAVPIGCSLMLVYEVLHLWIYLRSMRQGRAGRA